VHFLQPRDHPGLRLGPAVWVLLAWVAIPGGAKAQEIAVQNESNATVMVTAAEIRAMPHESVSVDEHGKTETFGGVPLRLVLEKGGRDIRRLLAWQEAFQLPCDSSGGRVPGGGRSAGVGPGIYGASHSSG